jgi:hypothetical protein
VNNAMAFGGAFMVTGALLIMYFALLKLFAGKSNQA